MTQHREGSRKGTIHGLFGNGNDENTQIAWTRGIKLGLAEGTLRSWFGTWRRENAAKKATPAKAKTAKKTAPKKTPAKKAAPKKVPAKGKATKKAEPKTEKQPEAVVA